MCSLWFNSMLGLNFIFLCFQACSAGVLGRAKAACLCSYCCNRHLRFYDGRKRLHSGDFVLNSLNHNICMHTCMYVCMHGCNCKCVVSVCICVYMWTDLHFMFFSFRIIIGLGVAVLVLGGCCYSFKRGREAFSQFCDR